MLIGAAGVGIRLWPLTQRTQVSWESLLPLIAAALTTIFESSLVVCAPVGFALAAVPDRESAPMKSAGSSILSLERGGIAVGVGLWIGSVSVLGAYANLRLGEPGRVAHGVVRAARAACQDAQRHRVEPVPLIGARWVCAPSSPPRIEGEFSKNGALARYSALDITVSGALDYVDLAGLKLAASATRERPALRLEVQEARVHGAWPWAKVKRMPGWWRAIYVAGLSATLGLAAMALIQRDRSTRWWTALTLGAIGGVTTWFVLGVADAHVKWHLASYAVVPLAGVVAMSAVALALLPLASWSVSRGLEVWRQKAT